MDIDSQTAKIRGFLVGRFPRVRGLGDDDRILGGGFVDSLGILEVVEFVEKEFGVAVSDDELTPENFQSISSVASMVRTKLGHSGRPAAGD
jgi:acyl carrier protein